VVGRREGVGFAVEPVRVLRIDVLESDTAAESRVIGTIDVAHPTTVNEAKDFVLAEAPTRQ
jgi:hypothetical protein